MESESPGGLRGEALPALETKSLRSFTTNDEYLVAMKEDLADWFAVLNKMAIDADTFFTILGTGVILCQHANKVQALFMEEGVSVLPMQRYKIYKIPKDLVIFRADVKPGTFQARDNVSNFIKWCKDLGIPDNLRFETEDLVMLKNERSVILCLLEVARVGAKLGMEAPTLVKMEQEIDQEKDCVENGAPPPQIITCDTRTLDQKIDVMITS